MGVITYEYTACSASGPHSRIMSLIGEDLIDYDGISRFCRCGKFRFEAAGGGRVKCLYCRRKYLPHRLWRDTEEERSAFLAWANSKKSREW